MIPQIPADYSDKTWLKSFWQELFGPQPQAVSLRNLQRFVERESVPVDYELNPEEL